VIVELEIQPASVTRQQTVTLPNEVDDWQVQIAGCHSPAVVVIFNRR